MCRTQGFEFKTATVPRVGSVPLARACTQFAGVLTPCLGVAYPRHRPILVLTIYCIPLVPILTTMSVASPNLDQFTQFSPEKFLSSKA